MKARFKNLILYGVLVIFGVSILFWGLIQAQSFLMPLTVAILLSMIVLPVCQWLEKKGMNRGWASFFADLIIVLFFTLVLGLLAAQVTAFADDWPEIKKKAEPRIDQLQDFIEEKTGYSIGQESLNLENESQGNQSDTDNVEGKAKSRSQQKSVSEETQGAVLSYLNQIIQGLFSSMSTLLLIVVYVFFFLLYRSRFKTFLLKILPPSYQDEAKEIVSESADVSQNYLFGRILLILFLSVIYAVGLILSGVENAILIAMLAALLSLLPYIGNVIGFVIAILMAFLSGSEIWGAIGVTATFTIAQFIESYILEPYIVGERVNLNPIATIIVVVLGGAVWGIVGMLISIPLLGIMKVVFDTIPGLEAFGYILGNENGSGQSKGFIAQLRAWFKGT
jgi:predicted PurR-regulated permease PerM